MGWKGCVKEWRDAFQPNAAITSPMARKVVGTLSEGAAPNWKTVGAAFECPLVFDAPPDEVDESVLEVAVPVGSTVDPPKGVVAVFEPRMLLALAFEAVGWEAEGEMFEFEGWPAVGCDGTDPPGVFGDPED